MSLNRKLGDIIESFCEWYDNDPHSKNRNYYSDTITKTTLSNLNESDFKRFFIDFVRNGGKVQSGGHRTITNFTKTIENKLDPFKEFILRPFNPNFNLENWFKEIDDYKGFGVGIATIYLNRIDSTSYPILNNKTIKALNKIGYPLSSSKNYTNYKKVVQYQSELIRLSPQLIDFYKTDSLTHYLISVLSGRVLISTLNQIDSLEHTFEQLEIEFRNLNDTNYKELAKKIDDCENDKSETIELKGKSYKRNSYLFFLIKRYRNFQCQFCEIKLSIGKGKYYIEACHIKPKSEGGKDTLNNILVLCPNCHKTFDYAERKNEKKNGNIYYVKINGKEYSVNLD